MDCSGGYCFHCRLRWQTSRRGRFLNRSLVDDLGLSKHPFDLFLNLHFLIDTLHVEEPSNSTPKIFVILGKFSTRL